jgi:hypothetical protein
LLTKTLFIVQVEIHEAQTELVILSTPGAITIPTTDVAGPSQIVAPVVTNLEMPRDLVPHEFADEVSFGTRMAIIDRFYDYVEEAHISRYSAPTSKKRKQPMCSSDSSSMECSLQCHSDVSVCSPEMEEFYDCACSGVLGKHEIVLLHLSSDSDCTIDSI